MSDNKFIPTEIPQEWPTEKEKKEFFDALYDPMSNQKTFWQLEYEKKDAEIASLRAEVEKEKLRAKKHLNQLLEACDRCVKIEVVEGDKLYKENMALRARCEAAEAKAEQLKAWIVGCKNVECMRSSKKSLIVAALVSDDPC